MMNEINVKEAPLSAVSNGSKKVKISQFALLMERAKEINVKVDSKKFDVEPSWDLVDFSEGLISSYNDAKRVRVASDAEKRAEARWDSYRQKNVYDKNLESDFNFDTEISSNEESFDNESTYTEYVPDELKDYSKVFTDAVREVENVKTFEENTDIPVYSSEPEMFDSVPNSSVDMEKEDESVNESIEENDFSKKIEEQVHQALQNLDLQSERSEEEVRKDEDSKGSVSDSISELEQLKKQYLESLKLNVQTQERIAVKEKNIEKKENCIKSLQTGTIAFYKAGIEKLNTSLEQNTAKDDYLTSVDREVTAKLMDADAAYWEAKNHTEETGMVDESVARKIA